MIKNNPASARLYPINVMIIGKEIRYTVTMIRFIRTPIVPSN